MTGQRLRVLCVADYYLPGFKGGGPIRTLANMQSALSDRIEFNIFTRDRDLGEPEAYVGVVSDRWSSAEFGSVYYASKRNFGLRGLLRAMQRQSFDAIYLNSFFSFRGSISILIGMRVLRLELPVILAPRGEFAIAALSIKRVRKRLYLYMAGRLALYKYCKWHASTPAELDDIRRQFPSANIEVAEDPVSLTYRTSDSVDMSLGKQSRFRIVFVSRISPMKNLDYLLEVLQGATALIDLDIFGPLEDSKYWRRCLDLIAELPAGVSAQYRGPIDPDMVSDEIAGYDLFVLPTQGENFGHVIFEALRAGTPVVLSDRTSWKPDPEGAVVTLPLDDAMAWRDCIESLAHSDADRIAELKRSARRYAENYVATSDTGARNLALFQRAVNSTAAERII